MSRRDTKNKILRELYQGSRDLDELQVVIGNRRVTKKELSQILDVLIKDGIVERYAKKYQLKPHN